MKELTEEEQVYYANYGMCEDCDICGDLRGYINYHEGGIFIEYYLGKFICCKCKEIIYAPVSECNK